MKIYNKIILIDFFSKLESPVARSRLFLLTSSRLRPRNKTVMSILKDQTIKESLYRVSFKKLKDGLSLLPRKSRPKCS